MRHGCIKSVSYTHLHAGHRWSNGLRSIHSHNCRHYSSALSEATRIFHPPSKCGSIRLEAYSPNFPLGLPDYCRWKNRRHHILLHPIEFPIFRRCFSKTISSSLHVFSIITHFVVKCKHLFLYKIFLVPGVFCHRKQGK